MQRHGGQAATPDGKVSPRKRLPNAELTDKWELTMQSRQGCEDGKWVPGQGTGCAKARKQEEVSLPPSVT